MERFELNDDEWSEVLEVLTTEASFRKISTDDFPEMVLLFKKLWNLLTNRGRRQQQITHAKHRDLKDLREKQNKNVKDLDDEIDKLPRDPGPPNALRGRV